MKKVGIILIVLLLLGVLAMLLDKNTDNGIFNLSEGELKKSVDAILNKPSATTATVATTTNTPITTTTTKPKTTTTAPSTTTTAPKTTTTATTTASTNEPSVIGLYATPYGERYHYLSNCGGDNSSAISWDIAALRGLIACAICADGEAVISFTEPPPTEVESKQIVYWGETGTKMHISPSCRSFKDNTYSNSGTESEAYAAGQTEGWCGICSKKMNR